MDKLPDELINNVLDYLESTELIQLQGVSRRFLRLARDAPLWRFQCYYDSPRATVNRVGQKSWSQPLARSIVGDQQLPNGHTCMSKKARATDDWDLSDPSEKVNWYSEYISRHAQLSTDWLRPENTDFQDIRGAALFEDNGASKLVGPLEDGSLCVWDVSRKEGEPSRHARIGQMNARSSPGIVLKDLTADSASSQLEAKRSLAFSGVADCVSIDNARKRAYVAVGDLLNEVDLNTLKMVSQTKYAWTITALSQIRSPQQPLTIGTSFSLHILDPRSPQRDRSCSPVGRADIADSVAFFPNKDTERNIHPKRRLQIHPLNGFGITGLDPQTESHTPIPTSSSPNRRSLFSYAPLEPAPLSILHQTDHSIMVAGRFPSILNYDRRYFPRLEYVIHSSARLSALAYLPFSTRGINLSSTSEPQGTLISCGEYNGRGSLELYSIPHNSSSGPAETRSSKRSTFSNTDTTAVDFSANVSSPVKSLESDTTTDLSNTTPNTPPEIPSFRNRQTISSAKLLSVTTQGTRIVFSDADGGLKWIERDGRSIVRRWNINSYQLHQEAFPRLGRGASAGAGGSSGAAAGAAAAAAAAGQGPQRFEATIHGEEVVRKIIPTGMGEADDLLVWTGERVGLVALGRNQDQVFYDAREDGGSGDVVRMFDGLVGSGSGRRRDVEGGGGGGGGGGEGEGTGSLEEKAQEYDLQMRRALERQADELNWMQRFGSGGNP